MSNYTDNTAKTTIKQAIEGFLLKLYLLLIFYINY